MPQCVHVEPFVRFDRRAAVRAVHHLHVALQFLDLGGGQRTDEVLLAKEIEERDQPAVALGAAQILETCAALQVVRDQQRRRAVRACGRRRWWRVSGVGVVANEPKELERGAG